MRALFIVGTAATLVFAGATDGHAQPAGDSVRLGDLHRDAERTDRRAAQADLLASQSRLRLESLRTERLPTVGLLGIAQYLSDVPSIALPGGPPAPPNDNYDAYVSVRQRLLDPSLAPRRAVERAQLAESQARLRSALRAQRIAVNDAFFGALLLDAQRATLDAAITELEGQRDLAARRVSEGAALPSESARIDAELLRRRQARATLVADRSAVLDVLASLVGRPVPEDAKLALPSVTTLDSIVVDASARPEFEQFARSRAVLAERQDAASAAERPRVAAFARAGYGRPGLNPLARDFDSYWLAGVQLEWSPWTWGSTRREREVLELQSGILDADEAEFEAALERAATRAAAAARQLARTVESDEAIVALHRGILSETRLRYTEGVITSAELVDRETDLLDAELARATHRVQLAEAVARLLTTLGREVR